MVAQRGREEAVEAVDFAASTGREHDLVDAGAAPKFDGAVRGQVGETEFAHVSGVDDAVVTG